MFQNKAFYFTIYISWASFMFIQVFYTFPFWDFLFFFINGICLQN